MKSALRCFSAHSQSGGAALEYIIVSIFGLVLSLGAMSFLTKVAKQKLSSIESALGIEIDLDSFMPGSSG